MSRGPEGKYKTDIARKLRDTYGEAIYQQAMGALYSNGTPDRYYEGPKSDLWAEYKYERGLAKKTFIPKDLCTPLQARWLERAARNGRPAYLVVASGMGACVIEPLGPYWEKRIALSICKMTKADVVNWIHSITGAR